jgi:hypothetical protein
MQYGTEISLGGRIIRKSKNLRGMRDYARIARVVRVFANPCPKNTYNGKLQVVYANGAVSCAHFADYTCMLEWLANRRSWRTAKWHVAKPVVETWRGLEVYKALTVKLALLGVLQ